MCIIWTRPAGTPAISDAYLAESLANNPDGYGFAAYVDGALVSERFGPKGRAAFVKRYREVEATGATVIGHGRIATHGPKDADNAHPFRVEPEDGSAPYLLAHNGILGIRTEPGKSDTATYVEQVLRRLPGRWWENPALFYLVQSDLGYSNKFALLTGDGEVVIVNEGQGTVEGAMWFSNTSFRPYPKLATQWMPAAKPGHVAPNPASKRSMKRAAAAARKAAASKALVTVTPAVTSEDAYLPDPGMRSGGYPYITHEGHTLTATTPINRLKDGDYPMGATCDTCSTFFDLYVIDGSIYPDGGHHDREPSEFGGLVPVYAS